MIHIVSILLFFFFDVEEYYINYVMSRMDHVLQLQQHDICPSTFALLSLMIRIQLMLRSWAFLHHGLNPSRTG